MVSAITVPTAKQAPTAQNPSGTITGPAYEYIVTGGATYTLSYPAATTDKSKATLTHRVHLDDLPVQIARCLRVLEQMPAGVLVAVS